MRRARRPRRSAAISALVIAWQRKPCSGSLRLVELSVGRCWLWMPGRSICRPEWLSCMMNFAVEAVHRFAELRPQRDEVVAVDGRVAGDDAAFHQHRHVGRDDRADAALGELAFPVDARLGERAVLVVEAAGDVRAEDAVLDRQVAEPELLEDRVRSWRRLAGRRASSRPPRSSAVVQRGGRAVAPARRHEGDVGVGVARSRAASSSNRVSAPAGRFPERRCWPAPTSVCGTLSGARSERMTAASAETAVADAGLQPQFAAWRSRCAQGCARRPPSHGRRPGRCQLPRERTRLDRPTAPVTAQPESAQRVHVPRRRVEHARRLPRSAAGSVALGEEPPDRLLDQRAQRASPAAHRAHRRRVRRHDPWRQRLRETSTRRRLCSAACRSARSGIVARRHRRQRRGRRSCRLRRMRRAIQRLISGPPPAKSRSSLASAEAAAIIAGSSILYRGRRGRECASGGVISPRPCARGRRRCAHRRNAPPDPGSAAPARSGNCCRAPSRSRRGV